MHDEIVRAFRKGESVQEIAKRFGRYVDEVEQTLRAWMNDVNRVVQSAFLKSI